MMKGVVFGGRLGHPNPPNHSGRVAGFGKSRAEGMEALDNEK